MRLAFAPLLALFLVSRAGFCADWQVSSQIEINLGALTIDHSKSVAEISKAQAQGGFPGDRGVGLFQNRIKTELSIQQPEPANGQRLRLTTKVTTRPIIYVAKEFPESSCG
jgi:hypothetical protein